MAGTNPGFSAAEFRDAIHFAMKMGAPADPEAQVTFYFDADATTSAVSMDSRRVPFDPDADVNPGTGRQPLRVDCAVEYFDAEGQPTGFGLLTPSRLAITLLDVDYEQVVGTSYVVVHGDRYDFRRTEPPVGLFDAGIFTMHFTAQNET